MMKDVLTAVAKFFIGVIVALVAVTMLAHDLHMDSFQELIVGLLFFSIIVLLQVDFNLTRMGHAIEGMLARINVWNEIHDDVRTIATTHRQVEFMASKVRRIADSLAVVTERYPGEHEPFKHWYNQRLDELMGHIVHTLETDSFFVETSLLKEQDIIFNTFQGTDEDFFWATATCAGVASFLTPSGEIFLRAIDHKFQAKMIKSVRRLFTYERESELKDLRVDLCFYLHERSGYEYRVISRTEFETILNDFGDRSLVPDFGIYGNHYVWQTAQETYHVIEAGEFCTNAAKIAKYKQLFEHLWAQATEPAIAHRDAFAKYTECRMESFRKSVRGLDTTRVASAKSGKEVS